MNLLKDIPLTDLKGADLDDLFVNLVNVAGSEERASRGIIFLDDFDKVCNCKGEYSHIGTTDIQETLLNFIDGIKLNTKFGQGLMENHFSFDTRMVTFVLAGAFQDLVDDNKEIDDESLMNYGMIKELAGRISPIIRLTSPTKDDIIKLLNSSNYNYLNNLVKYFKDMGIDFRYDESYINYVASEAITLNCGYRGIKKIIDKDVDEHLFALKVGKEKRLILTKKN